MQIKNFKKKKLAKIVRTFRCGFYRLDTNLANLDQFFSTFHGKRKRPNCNAQQTHVIGAEKMAITDAFAANNTRASHTPTHLRLSTSHTRHPQTTLLQPHFLQCHHFHRHLPPTSDEDDRDNNAKYVLVRLKLGEGSCGGSTGATRSDH